MSDGYNGWNNYPTWAVNLWLSNDEGLYNAATELATTTTATARRSEWDNALRANVADAFKSWVCDELAPDLGASFAADLLGYALDQVDWHEIASAWLEDAATPEQARLEELRAELRAERISYCELAELQGLAEHIAPGDVELLEAAGVPEHDDDDDALTARARELGAAEGAAAASWYFDGNTDDATYRRVLEGMDDGDPEILDALPSSPLSGEWADGPTPATLAFDLGIQEDDERLDELCGAYEDGFYEASQHGIENVARNMLSNADNAR